MSHRTHRPAPKWRRARHRLVRAGQAAFYAASATLAAGLVREFLHLVHLHVLS
ncbi:hypothetical protein [Streptomyces sp. CC224B]|uniref:hypothetical protein n=1 Tax=Streptomyces sp. CC224B TaxID=3044571 RepID=UPI0024A8804C|nr:hypothetical protein [Streptomyces sp. CC224B]